MERTYERLVGKGSGYGAVMIVALADAENALLVEEYCGGYRQLRAVAAQGADRGRARMCWKRPTAS